MVGVVASAADATLGRLFWERVEKSRALPAQMIKRSGRWYALTWTQVGEVVHRVGLGLLALDRKRGDAIALLSRSRAEWVQADFAILSAGCVTIPIYPTYTPEQIAYLVNDSQARTLVVEDPAQLAKVLEVWTRMSRLEQVVVIEGYEGQQSNVLTWEALQRLGAERADDLKSVLVDRLASARHEDVATIVYTSGTTGPPKGVIQTHRNHVAALGAAMEVAPVKPGDVHLLFLPLAHSFARLEAFMGVYGGLTTAFAESLDKVGENIRDVRPHFIVGVPRVLRAAREPRRPAPIRGVRWGALVCGDRGVLPRDRALDPRRVWVHRKLPGAGLQPRRPLPVRLRGPCRSGCRAQARRGRRDPGAWPQHRHQGLLEPARGYRRDIWNGRLAAHG